MHLKISFSFNYAYIKYILNSVCVFVCEPMFVYKAQWIVTNWTHSCNHIQTEKLDSLSIPEVPETPFQSLYTHPTKNNHYSVFLILPIFKININGKPGARTFYCWAYFTQTSLFVWLIAM